MLIFSINLLEDTYPTMTHQYDVWHGSKNLMKKLSKVIHIIRAYSIP
jgi:hypothetical protein